MWIVRWTRTRMGGRRNLDEPRGNISDEHDCTIAFILLLGSDQARTGGCFDVSSRSGGSATGNLLGARVAVCVLEVEAVGGRVHFPLSH